MLSCKEVVKIVSSEERPSWRRRLEIRFHLMMCHHCGKYVKQLELMKSGFKKLLQSKHEKANQEKIRDLENKVIEKTRTNI